MALCSMTGFARADGGDATRWSWELRSVNGKGLDVRLRLPPGFERLERDARDRCVATLGRGNIQASLSVTSDAGAQALTINEDVLARMIDAVRRIGERIDTAPPAPWLRIGTAPRRASR